MSIIHPGNLQSILSPRCAMDAMKYSRVKKTKTGVVDNELARIPLDSHIKLSDVSSVILDEDYVLVLSKQPHSWFISDHFFKDGIHSLIAGRRNSSDLNQSDLSVLYRKGLLSVNGNFRAQEDLSGRYSVCSDNVALISITDRCNLSCGHCVANANENGLSGEELKPEELKKVFHALSEDLNPYGLDVEKKVFISGGEPLIRSDLESIAIACSDEGLSTHICTNGLLVTDQVLKSLRGRNVAFSVSLDGERQNHERVRGGETFDYTIDTIRKMRQNGFDVFINTFLHESNIGDMRYLLNFGAENGVRGINFIRAIPRGRGKGMDFKRVPDKRLFRKLFNFMQEDSEFYRMIENENTFSILAASMIAGVKSLNCGMSRGNYFFMDSSGDIYPCPGTRYPEFKIGNIRTSELDYIMNQRKSHPLADLRADTFPVCSRCDFTYFCGGDCRGSAYGNDSTKDIKSPVPYCSERRESLLEIFKILARNPDFLTDKSSWIIENAREETRRQN